MKREAFFDNAKLFLIFLVVFGHMIQPFMAELTVISVIYRFIYLFHMPAMILLSGFFAKGIGKPGYLLDLTRKLLIPYFVFQLIYTCYYYFTKNGGWDASLSEPHWSLWFLLSLSVLSEKTPSSKQVGDESLFLVLKGREKVNK